MITHRCTAHHHRRRQTFDGVDEALGVARVAAPNEHEVLGPVDAHRMGSQCIPLLRGQGIAASLQGAGHELHVVEAWKLGDQGAGSRRGEGQQTAQSLRKTRPMLLATMRAPQVRSLDGLLSSAGASAGEVLLLSWARDGSSRTTTETDGGAIVMLICVMAAVSMVTRLKMIEEDDTPCTPHTSRWTTWYKPVAA